MTTDSFDKLDFAFEWLGDEVQIDLKEKRQRYNPGYGRLWDAVNPDDLFILDETVYRRIIWQGRGGYLAIHDHPQQRWALFGPWELTLGSRVRFRRWGQRGGSRFAKGKLLLNLGAGAWTGPEFQVQALLDLVEATRRQRDSVDAVVTQNLDLPEIG